MAAAAVVHAAPNANGEKHSIRQQDQRNRQALCKGRPSHFHRLVLYNDFDRSNALFSWHTKL